MTKSELLKELQFELDKANIGSLDGINAGCNKSEIENAVNCMKCSDEQMLEYLIVIELKYPGIYETITKSNFLRHRFNRLYVYNTARMLLA